MIGEEIPLVACETCDGCHAAGEPCGMRQKPTTPESIAEAIEAAEERRLDVLAALIGNE